MKLYVISGYHPESDGQTKGTNQTLEQYIYLYCNYQQDNGLNFFPLWNSPTTMPQVQQQEYPCSLQTKDTTQI